MEIPVSQPQLNVVTAYVAKVSAGGPVPTNDAFLTARVNEMIASMRNELRNDFLAAFMLRFQSLSPSDRALVNAFMLSKPVDAGEL